MSWAATLLGFLAIVLFLWQQLRQRRTPELSTKSLWSIAWRQFYTRRLNRWAGYFIGTLFLVAFFGDFLASDLPIVLHHDGETYVFPNLTHPLEIKTLNNTLLLSGGLGEDDWALFPPIPYGPNEDMGLLGSSTLEEPGKLHPLGTDDRGRDIAARMIHGARVTLFVGVFAVGLYVAIGIFLGATAGFFGGRWDILVERLTEVFISFPALFLILTIQALLPTTAGFTSVLQLVLVIGLTGWTQVSRLVRAEVMRVKTLEYVMAAKAGGLSAPRILMRHILPNALGPVLVAATFGIAGAVLIESALSFLGFGVQPPMASWGELLQQARVSRRAWMIVYPGLAVFLSVTAYNLAGEGLRDALDPRLRNT